MPDNIDILDLLHLLEDHSHEAIATIARLAICEIKDLRQQLEHARLQLNELDPVEPDDS